MLSKEQRDKMNDKIKGTEFFASFALIFAITSGVVGGAVAESGWLRGVLFGLMGVAASKAVKLSARAGELRAVLGIYDAAEKELS